MTQTEMKRLTLRVISGFRREADDSSDLALLAARCGNSYPTFRGNLTVPYSRINNPNKTAGNPSTEFTYGRV